MTRATNGIERLPLLQDHDVARYALAVVVCLLALAARWAMAPYFPPGYPFVTFFPAVILTSFVLGRNAGILAAVLSGSFSWYFFIPPAKVFGLDSATFVAMTFYSAVVTVDILVIHWLQLANRQLRNERERNQRLAEESAQLAERSELLFQELQHRVGNNLQMVASVLSLQLRGLDEPRAHRAITDAVSRVQVIGAIQRRLYRNNGALMPLDHFITEVCDQIMRSNGRPGIACDVHADSGLVLPPDAAVPMALILAEALANALEHGFHDRDEGRITVVLQRDGANVTMRVTDDGAGLPEGFDVTRADSLGLRISRILSRQLGASYALERAKPGCMMCVTLPSDKFAASRA